MDWNFQREDDDDEDDEDEDGGDWDTNADGCSPKDDRDCDAQGDPSLAKNVGLNNSASTFLNSKPLHSATICLIDWQHFEKCLLCFGAHLPLYVVPFDMTRTLINIFQLSSLFRGDRWTISVEVG